jgi:TRAP-type C4-dicarboxylate transport system substrate-binding protein
LGQLSPATKKAVEKMAKKGIDDPDQLAKTLTQEELESVAKELTNFSLEGTEFDNCTENAEQNLAQYEGDLMQAMMEAGGDEEKFQENFQQAMVDVMKKEKKVCGTFYYFFLIGMKQGGK